jgi:HAD superfamily phosphatase (TIGR01668 family)
MAKSLIPDMKFEKYNDITPAFLMSEGILALLIDIDNTLAPYEQPEPDEKHFGWLRELSGSGIRCALISNNKPARVDLFARRLGIPAYADCGKPKTKYLRMALDALGVKPQNAAILGDQIFTDCLAARRMGMKAYIVLPIKDKKTLFFRIKRFFEKPFLSRVNFNKNN